MNLKTTYILFGLVFAVLLVVGLLQIFNPKNPTAESEYVFPDLVNKEGNVTPSEVDSLRVERTIKGKKENLLFVREGSSWELREPAKLRVEHFPSLRTPAMFVHGTRDSFGSIEALASALRLIPARTRLIPVEGAAHGLPPRLARHIDEWFSAFTLGEDEE